MTVINAIIFFNRLRALIYIYIYIYNALHKVNTSLFHVDILSIVESEIDIDLVSAKTIT